MHTSSPPCGDWGIALMDRLKLQWKIFAFLLVFCALLLLVFWLFQTVFLGEMYKFIRRNEIEKAIAQVEQNIDNPDLQSIFTELDDSREIFVSPSREFLPPQSQDEANKREKRKMESITRERVFVRADGSKVSLTFHAMITPVDATVATLHVQLYFITGIMLILAVLLALLIARRVSKPIVEINKSAKQLAAGQYDTQFQGHGFLEIKELSDTLNTAAGELSKVEGLRRELMANISHDLRTPLAFIYSYAEMMHDFPEEITAEQTQIIMDETKRLSSLVNDVLDVSRLESGTMVLHKMRYPLTGSIQASVERMEELLRQDGYVLEFIRKEEVYVFADEVKITQAFYNLLLNAITHGGADHRVTILQSVEQGSVKIAVTDQGPGIAPEDLPYIWDRYYKVDQKHKRSVTGTGLGLSIVKKILVLHGGNYGVDSAPSKGSTFWFQLPLEDVGKQLNLPS